MLTRDIMATRGLVMIGKQKFDDLFLVIVAFNFNVQNVGQRQDKL